jgi:hypothetical protein
VDWCPYGAGENKHNHCIAPLEITALGQSWLVSPLAAGLLLGSLLLIALWQAPELLVWLPLALFAAWVMWRRRRFGEDVDWLGRRLGRRPKLKSGGKAENANGRFLTALTALSARAERTRGSNQPKQPPKELLH